MSGCPPAKHQESTYGIYMTILKYEVPYIKVQTNFKDSYLERKTYHKWLKGLEREITVDLPVHVLQISQSTQLYAIIRISSAFITNHNNIHITFITV